MALFKDKEVNQRIQELQSQIQELQQENNAKSQQLNDANLKLGNLEMESTLRDCELDARAAQNPLFDFKLDKQFLQNGNYNTNLNIMVKQSMLNRVTNANESECLNFFTWKLILERAQYFKSRVKFENVSLSDKRLLHDCLYWCALNGWIALTDKKEIVSIESIESDGTLKGQLINRFNLSSFEQKEIKTKDFIIMEFNENHFGLYVIAWEYLININKYFKILDTQSKYLIKQLAVKLEREDLNASKQKLTEGLFNTQNPVLFVDKNVTLAPLETPADSLQAIFTFIENFQNYMDFHLLNMNVKDVTSDKERDVASQQMAFSNLAAVKNNYLNLFVDCFIDDFNDMFGTQVKIIDYLNEQLQMQGQQSQSFNKLNDNEEREKEENDN